MPFPSRDIASALPSCRCVRSVPAIFRPSTYCINDLRAQVAFCGRLLRIHYRGIVSVEHFYYIFTLCDRNHPHYPHFARRASRLIPLLCLSARDQVRSVQRVRMGAERPFFSIVTASLNNASTLGDTLNSVSTQRFDSVEHIVIDGDSQDDTLRILNSFKDKYNLRWSSEPDQGISDALNKGIRLATGRYILIIQADDFLYGDDVLARAYELLRNEQYDIYSFPVFVIYQNGRKVLYGPRKYTRLRYHFKNIFPHQGTFVHSRMYDRIGLFRDELKISMDYDFFYRCMNANASFCKGTIPLAVWRGAGVSDTEKYRRIKEEMRVQDFNEKNALWRAAQKLFRVLYLPYRRIHSIVSRSYDSNQSPRSTM